MKKPLTLFLLLLLTACAGCNHDGQWRDDGMDQNVRRQIEALNGKVVQALLDRQSKDLLKLCSDSLKKQKSGLVSLMTDEFNQRIRKQPFRMEHIFQINGAPGKMYNLTSDFGTARDYAVSFYSGKHEHAVAFGCFDDSLFTTAMMTIWAKTNGDWKLTTLWCGPYKILGQDAIYWYEQATAEFNRSDVIDAYLHLTLAAYLLNPGGSQFHYNSEQQIKKLGDEIKSYQQDHIKLPLELSSVSSVPVILSVRPFVREGQCRPQFYYQTRIPLADTAAVMRECDSIHHDLPKLFREIDERNKTTLYRAYNHQPQSFDDSDCYEMERSNKHYYWYHNQ